MTPEKLMELAKEAMTHAYVPYSGYKVGAALLCADGTVYQGCNMENAAYSPTVCASAQPSSRPCMTATGILPPSQSAAARTAFFPECSPPVACAGR